MSKTVVSGEGEELCYMDTGTSIEYEYDLIVRHYKKIRILGHLPNFGHGYRDTTFIKFNIFNSIKMLFLRT